eukprot:6481035-Amphidinium_carterae.2
MATLTLIQLRFYGHHPAGVQPGSLAKRGAIEPGGCCHVVKNLATIPYGRSQVSYGTHPGVDSNRKSWPQLMFLQEKKEFPDRPGGGNTSGHGSYFVEDK